MNRRDFGRTILAAGTVPLVAASGCISPAPTRASAPSVRRGARGREVRDVFTARHQLEGAGFPVTRPFPTPALALMDPFVLLDEFGPVQWAPGEARGAPDHPHRGFETVTYMRAGVNQHRDSLGNRGVLRPGDVQWMTAGAGIVHAELPSDEIVRDGGDVHGFQLWVNLPARQKRVPPGYQYFLGDRIALASSADGRARVRVIAGEAFGQRAEIHTHTPIAYQHWMLDAGARVDHPIASDHAACAFVFRGASRLGENSRVVREGELAVLGPGDRVRIEVAREETAGAELMLMSGVPIGEPVARWGPFVMNTDEEIRQAIDDYRSGRMGRIPG